MPEIDLRSKLLPAYQQIIGTFNTGCETNTLVQMLHAGAPIDAGWQPGVPYGYSRAYTEYFDNHEKQLGSNLLRTIRSTMKWVAVPERLWPTHMGNQNVSPPADVITQAVFPIKGYEVIPGTMNPNKLFQELDKNLEAGHVIGCYLEMTDAIQKVGPDGLLPNYDTPHEIYHVVPMFGKLRKQWNPNWYGFRNHGGTDWGDGGDFYAHKSYLRRHKDNCTFYVIHFS